MEIKRVLELPFLFHGKIDLEKFLLPSDFSQYNIINGTEANFNDESFATLVDNIHKFPNLTILDCRNNFISSKSFLTLRKLFERAPNLRYLIISSNSLPKKPTSRLLENHKPKNMTVIYLTNEQSNEEKHKDFFCINDHHSFWKIVTISQ